GPRSELPSDQAAGGQRADGAHGHHACRLSAPPGQRPPLSVRRYRGHATRIRSHPAQGTGPAGRLGGPGRVRAAGGCRPRRGRSMKQSSHAWSRGYARQAQADLDAREVLLGATVPACQHLHFLQMACEQIARELLRRSAFAADLEVAPRGLEAMVRQLARKVDLLAPAVDDDGRRPDNCEYPWEDDGGALHVPAEHGFGPLGTLHRHRAGATFLKIVAAAAAELAGGFYAAS